MTNNIDDESDDRESTSSNRDPWTDPARTDAENSVFGRDTTDAPTNVNEQVTAEWVADTTPCERVQTVMKRTYEPQSTDDIAERAHTSPTRTRQHLDTLVEAGYVDPITDNDHDATHYKRSNMSRIMERATRILTDADPETVASRIAEMQTTLQTYRDTYGAASPEDAVLAEVEIDIETIRNWQTTRRNLRFAQVALALHEADRTLQVEQQDSEIAGDREP